MIRQYNTVLLFSGGLDSAVAAGLLSVGDRKPLCVYVRQGFSNHDRAVSVLSSNMGLDLHEFDMENVYNKLGSVSKRNFIFGYRLYTWQLALSIAHEFEVPMISTGEYCFPPIDDSFNIEMERFSSFLDAATSADVPESKSEMENVAIQEALPDARRDYATTFSNLQTFGGRPRQIYDPLYGFDKVAIIKLGRMLNVPMHLSSSCRGTILSTRKEVLNCGSCSFCANRIEAFKLAGVTDLTVYETACT